MDAKEVDRRWRKLDRGRVLRSQGIGLLAVCVVFTVLVLLAVLAR